MSASKLSSPVHVAWSAELRYRRKLGMIRSGARCHSMSVPSSGVLETNALRTPA